MPARSGVPSYRRHKQSGQAVVTLPDGLGSRRDVLLGRYGTAASRHEYARVVAEWEAAGRTLPPSAAAGKDLTVNELILAFWPHAEAHYRRPDGSPTRELDDYRYSLRPLKQLYGHTPAREFGPLALKAVREAMVSQLVTRRHKVLDAETGKARWEDKVVGTGLARNVVNQRVGRIRRLFRWAVEQEVVPASVYQGLLAVRGLQRGRSAARETEPVKPVPEAFVRQTLPFLRPQAAAMAELQLYSGMRPSEVVIMRGIDLTTSGKVWLYRPGSDQGPHGTHKTAWRGHDRVIALGPKAQEVLRPWLRPNLQEYLFQPREAEAARDAERAKQRKTKKTPSQARRRPKRSPKRAPGGRYSVETYARAVARACAKAEAHAHEQNPDVLADRVLVPHWHPNQLRHTKATEIRREAGLDAARVVLGHRSPNVTEVYAEVDAGKAAAVMERLG